MALNGIDNSKLNRQVLKEEEEITIEESLEIKRNMLLFINLILKVLKECYLIIRTKPSKKTTKKLYQNL